MFLGESFYVCLVVIVLDTKCFIFRVVFIGGMASQYNDNKIVSRKWVRNSNQKWENKYWFININNRYLYFMCNAIVAIARYIMLNDVS